MDRFSSWHAWVAASTGKFEWAGTRELVLRSLREGELCEWAEPRLSCTTSTRAIGTGQSRLSSNARWSIGQESLMR